MFSWFKKKNEKPIDKRPFMFKNPYMVVEVLKENKYYRPMVIFKEENGGSIGYGHMAWKPEDRITTLEGVVNYVNKTLESLKNNYILPKMEIIIDIYETETIKKGCKEENYELQSILEKKLKNDDIKLF